jgi:aarF domain-containing kinase
MYERHQTNRTRSQMCRCKTLSWLSSIQIRTSKTWQPALQKRLRPPRKLHLRYEASEMPPLFHTDSLTADWQTATEALSNSDPAAYQMRESRVPSSRFARIWQYGGLATSMAFGAVGESFRRATGTGVAGGSLMLSEANMERLVAKLSRMRGAALKLGQMMSFQGEQV